MYAKYATHWKKRNSRDSGRALSKSFLVDISFLVASLMLTMVAIVFTLGNFCLLSHLFQHVPYILGRFKGQWEQGPHSGASYLHSFSGSILPLSRLHLSKVILTLSNGRQYHTSMLGDRGKKLLMVHVLLR